MSNFLGKTEFNGRREETLCEYMDDCPVRCRNLTAVEDHRIYGING